jgi:hypothetical protein
MAYGKTLTQQDNTMKLLYKIIIALTLVLLVQLALSAQNTKPIPMPDTLSVQAGDTGFINLIANDRDAQGDAMRMTKFWRYNTPIDATVNVRISIADTGSFVFNRSGALTVIMLNPGTYKFAYIVNDFKAGGGKTGYVTVVVTAKAAKANDWMDIGIKYGMLYKDSSGCITAYMGSIVYSGCIEKWATGCAIKGKAYRQWHGAELKWVQKDWVLYLTDEVYEWARQ